MQHVESSGQPGARGWAQSRSLHWVRGECRARQSTQYEQSNGEKQVEPTMSKHFDLLYS